MSTIARPFGWLVLALALTLTGGAGCGNPSIELTADKTQLCAGGIDHTDIKALVKLTSGTAKAGIMVSFSIDGDGSFSADLTNALTTQDVVTDATGVAKVTLYSGKTVGGTGTINASYQDSDSGDSASATLTVKYITPSATCGQTNAPSGSHFTLSCDVFNIAALRDPMPDIHVPCHLVAQTNGGTAIPSGSLDVTWLLEAGTVAPVTDETGTTVFMYTPSGQPAPGDPGANDAFCAEGSTLGEPTRSDAIGTTRCPRLGLVTLVAATKGQEGYVDANANGQYDVGENFTDIGEPYVDVNDNGQYDDGEPYFDTNGNGSWDGPNGTWDSDTMIWAVTYLLWTGPPAVDQKTSTTAATHYTLSGNSPNITTPNTLSVALYLRDENLNPVAGFDSSPNGPGDLVNFVTQDSTIGLSDTSAPVKNQLGFTLRPNPSVGESPIVGQSFLKDTPYRFTIITYSGTTGAYTVGFQTVLSPGPDSPSSYISELYETVADATGVDLTVKGTVKDPATTP